MSFGDSSFRSSSLVGRVVLLVLFGLVYVLASVTFSGCPAPPVQETTQNDGSTVWRPDGAPIVIETLVDGPKVDEPLPAVPVLFTGVQVSKTREPLYCAVANAKIALVAGDEAIYRSDNAGTGWTRADTGSFSGVIRAMSIHQAGQRVLAVGGSGEEKRTGIILLSEDAGSSWQVVHIVQPLGEESRMLRGAVWINELTALAVGMSEQILRTTDGGKTWSPFANVGNDQGGRDWFAIQYQDPNLLLSGSKQTILQSTDAGTSWKTVLSNESNPALLSLAFLNGDEVIATGREGSGFRSLNRGGDWKALTFDVFPGDDTMHSTFSTGGVVVALSERTFWLSKNRGGTWRDFALTTEELPNQFSLTGGVFVSQQVAILTTTNGSILRAELK
jgi:photosystem II stability/assembly factor-like uncharacterized protein